MFLLDRTWNAARDMERLRDEIDHLFSGASGQVHEHPPVNVWSNEQGSILTAELPGLCAADIEISVLANSVTLKGTRPALKLADGETLLRNERPAGSFARTVRLPYRVDAARVEAMFQRGVLTVRLPRAEADLPRKIAVKTEQA